MLVKYPPTMKRSLGLVAIIGLTFTAVTGCASSDDSADTAASAAETPTTPREAPAKTPEVPPEPAAISEPVFTVAAVAGHSTSDDCWAIVNGSIYDLTQWISAHPGGSGPIESICGVDATAAFTNKHGGQGTPEARLAGFKIGILG